MSDFQNIIKFHKWLDKQNMKNIYKINKIIESDKIIYSKKYGSKKFIQKNKPSKKIVNMINKLILKIKSFNSNNLYNLIQQDGGVVNMTEIQQIYDDSIAVDDGKLKNFKYIIGNVSTLPPMKLSEFIDTINKNTKLDSKTNFNLLSPFFKKLLNSIRSINNKFFEEKFIKNNYQFEICSIEQLYEKKKSKNIHFILDDKYFDINDNDLKRYDGHNKIFDYSETYSIIISYFLFFEKTDIDYSFHNKDLTISYKYTGNYSSLATQPTIPTMLNPTTVSESDNLLTFIKDGTLTTAKIKKKTNKLKNYVLESELHNSLNDFNIENNDVYDFDLNKKVKINFEKKKELDYLKEKRNYVNKHLNIILNTINNYKVTNPLNYKKAYIINSYSLYKIFDYLYEDGKDKLQDDLFNYNESQNFFGELETFINDIKNNFEKNFNDPKKFDLYSKVDKSNFITNTPLQLNFLHEINKKKNILLNLIKLNIDEKKEETIIIDNFYDYILFILNRINLLFIPASNYIFEPGSTDRYRFNLNYNFLLKLLNNTDAYFNYLCHKINFDTNRIVVLIKEDKYLTFKGTSIQNYYREKKECIIGGNLNKLIGGANNDQEKKECITGSNLNKLIGGANNDQEKKECIKGGNLNKLIGGVNNDQEYTDYFLKFIDIWQTIFNQISKEIENFKIKEYSIGDTYYTLIRYRSKRKYKDKPIYVYASPNEDGMGGPNRLKKGICVFFTTKKLFKNNTNDLFLDVGINGQHFLDNTVNNSYNFEKDWPVQQISSTNPTPNPTPQSIDLRNVEFPFTYNAIIDPINKTYQNNLLDEFPIDETSIFDKDNYERPKVFYSGTNNNNIDRYKSDPNLYTDNTCFYYVNNPFNLADEEDLGMPSVGQIFQYDPFIEIDKFFNELFNPKPAFGPGNKNLEVNFPGFTKKEENLNISHIISRFTNAELRLKFINKNHINSTSTSVSSTSVSTSRYNGFIIDLCNLMNIKFGDSFFELLCWLMGRPKFVLQNKIEEQIYSVYDAINNPTSTPTSTNKFNKEKYFSDNKFYAKSTDGTEINLKIENSGYKYFEKLANAHGEKLEFLNDDIFKDYDKNMNNQKIIITDLEKNKEIKNKTELYNYLLIKFNLNKDDLKINEFRGYTHIFTDDKLKIILNFLPIGFLSSYRRFGEKELLGSLRQSTPLTGQTLNISRDDLTKRHYLYKYLNDGIILSPYPNIKIPGSHPIYYSLDNINNSISTLSNIIFRHHFNKSAYIVQFPNTSAPPDCDTEQTIKNLNSRKTLYPLSFHNKFKFRDNVGLDHYKKDWFPSPTGNSLIVNAIHSDPTKFGYISKRLDSYSLVDDTFGVKFKPMTNILNKFVALGLLKYLKNNVENINNDLFDKLPETAKLFMRNISSNEFLNFSQLKKKDLTLEDLIIKKLGKVEEVITEKYMKNKIKELIYKINLYYISQNANKNTKIFKCLTKDNFYFIYENMRSIIDFNNKPDDYKNQVVGPEMSKILLNHNSIFIILESFLKKIEENCSFSNKKIIDNQNQLNQLNSFLLQTSLATPQVPSPTQQIQSPTPQSPTPQVPSPTQQIQSPTPQSPTPQSPTQTQSIEIPEFFKQFIIIQIINGNLSFEISSWDFCKIFKRRVERIYTISPINNYTCFKFKTTSLIKFNDIDFPAGTEFKFVNNSGSNKFNENYFIIKLLDIDSFGDIKPKIEFSKDYDFLLAFSFMDKLILSFLNAKSSQFRTYLVINDFLLDNIDDVSNQGITFTPTNYIGELENLKLNKRKIVPRTNPTDIEKYGNKNKILKILGDYYSNFSNKGTDISYSNKINYVHDFNLDDANKAIDTINKLFGYKIENKVFSKKHSEESDDYNEILKINMNICNQLISGSYRDPFVTDLYELNNLPTSNSRTIVQKINPTNISSIKFSDLKMKIPSKSKFTVFDSFNLRPASVTVTSTPSGVSSTPTISPRDEYYWNQKKKKNSKYR